MFDCFKQFLSGVDLDMAMVRDLPLEDRPRERLISHGSEHLSNAELLAILIRSGSKDKSAIQLAEEVL